MYSSEVHDASAISLLDLWIVKIFTHTVFLCPQKTQRIELFAGCCNQLRPRSLEPSMSPKVISQPFWPAYMNAERFEKAKKLKSLEPPKEVGGKSLHF